jgi:hypothetical protein
MTGFSRKDRPEPRPGEKQPAHYTSVTPGYFEALSIRVQSGRTFSDRLTKVDPLVAPHDPLTLRASGVAGITSER